MFATKKNNESHKISVKELIFLFKKSAGRSGAIFHQYSEFWTEPCDHLTRQTGDSVRRSLLASEGNNAVSAAAAVLDTKRIALKARGWTQHAASSQAARHRVKGGELSRSQCSFSINSVSPTMHLDSGTRRNNKVRNNTSKIPDDKGLGSSFIEKKNQCTNFCFLCYFWILVILTDAVNVGWNILFIQNKRGHCKQLLSSTLWCDFKARSLRKAQTLALPLPSAKVSLTPLRFCGFFFTFTSVLPLFHLRSSRHKLCCLLETDELDLVRQAVLDGGRDRLTHDSASLQKRKKFNLEKQNLPCLGC